MVSVQMRLNAGGGCRTIETIRTLVDAGRVLCLNMLDEQIACVDHSVAVTAFQPTQMIELSVSCTLLCSLLYLNIVFVILQMLQHCVFVTGRKVTIDGHAFE